LRVYIWVEGVQFDRTIYDTEDVATIRGSSMYLEGLAEALDKVLAPLGATLTDFGASRAVFRFDDRAKPGLATALAAFCTSDIWQHFCLIHGFGDSDTSARTEASLRQLRGWSIPLSGPISAKGPDALDGVRPATLEDRRPENKIRFLSPSVMARRKNGLKNRPNSFADPMVPPPTFEDIVTFPKNTLQMPEVVRGKLAVVVADGIGIGDLRKTYPAGPDFAKAIQTFRNRISRAVVDWVQDKDRGKALIGTRTEDGQDKLFPRLDVLVWGGDDMTFVLPASHLLEFLEMLIGEFDQPFANGKSALPHRIGCIIANHKVPIRQMRALASDAEGRLKQVAKAAAADTFKGKSLFSIDIFESAALPYDSLGPYRKKLYQPLSGTDNHDPEHAFTGSELAMVRAFLTETIGDGPGCIATSKLHDVLRRAVTNALSGPGEVVSKELYDHFSARGEPDPSGGWPQGYVARKTLPVFLAQMAQLHPYSQVRA
jgi:hypothetical protein